MPKNQPIKQGGTGGQSAKIPYGTGSGSRPGGSKFTIPSSNPSNAKNPRGK